MLQRALMRAKRHIRLTLLARLDAWAPAESKHAQPTTNFVEPEYLTRVRM